MSYGVSEPDLSSLGSFVRAPSGATGGHSPSWEAYGSLWLGWLAGLTCGPVLVILGHSEWTLCSFRSQELANQNTSWRVSSESVLS